MLAGKRHLFRKTIRSARSVFEKAIADGAGVVSVDMFDTLVFRTTLDPNSVFTMQHQACADVLARLSPGEWLRARKDAEEALSKAAWPKEIELSAIYDRVAATLGLSAQQRDRLFNAELSVEARVIKPYDDLVAVLGQLRASGRTIVVTTDTYLPEPFIREVLSRFLSFDFTLACSSTLGATKRSGSMFAHLRSTFAGQTIVHFGDNPHSDVTMARGSGVIAHGIEWRRPAVLQEWKLNRFMRNLGVTSLRTPWDGQTDEQPQPLDQIAWRWSFVLADFLMSVRDYADRIGATDIWFLSRDSETMFKSLTDVPELFAGRRCRYVYGSRACVYPVIARSDPALYEKWRGKAPTEDVQNSGDIAQRYYQSLITPDTKRILMVDIGWKGRLQILFQRIMPKGIDVYGYYFSLEPAAVPAIQTISSAFIDWNPSVFNQAMVEALSGYVEASATGLRETNGGYQPIYRDGAGDRSPVRYCEQLRLFLTELLRGGLRHPAASTATGLESREAIVQQMSLYPDHTMVSGFAEWSIGTLVDGSDTVNIANGGGATWWQKLAGRGDSGNVWPSASIWTLTASPMLARLFQHGIWALYSLKYLIEGRTYATTSAYQPPRTQTSGL